MKQTDQQPISTNPLADGAGHTFFKILNRAGSLRVMPRTSRKLAITHGAQFPAQGLPGDDDANTSKIHWQRSTIRHRTIP